MIYADAKTENYLKNNIYVNTFVTQVEKSISEYYAKNYPSLENNPITVCVGLKYVKIIHNTSVWGFISRYNGTLKGFPVKKGDLLKAASWNSPAAHSRGNITDGTAKYDRHGPLYLK